MGIFRRVNDIISANLNDMVDRFEDPEKMLKQAIREMESSIEQATGAAARAIASDKLLAKEVAEHEHHAAEWHGRAEAAVKAGDDELARKALARKQEHQNLLRALRDQLASAQQTGQTLRRQVEAMKAKYAEAKRKLATLTARQKAATARLSMQAAVPNPRLATNGFSRFERMREKIELAEAEADALIAMNTSPEEELETTLSTREEDVSIEAELAAMKQNISNQLHD